MQKSNVLIVDDAQINRELLEFILQDHYQVFQAENGSQAIEMIESQERIYRHPNAGHGRIRRSGISPAAQSPEGTAGHCHFR